MKTIYKYTLIPTNGNNIIISMPIDAHILHVHEQRHEICMWAMVDTDTKLVEPRYFKVFGTGHSIYNDGKNMQYIGTVHLHHLELVFHVFEVIIA